MKFIIHDVLLHSGILWFVDKEHLSSCLPKLSIGHRRDGKVCCSPVPYSDPNLKPTRFLHPQTIDYIYEGPQAGCGAMRRLVVAIKLGVGMNK